MCWLLGTLVYALSLSLQVVAEKRLQPYDEKLKETVSDPPELQLKESAAISLVFSWKIPNNPNGVISKYKIKCCRKNCKETIVKDDIDPNSSNATVDGLASLTFYYCQIQAFTGSGTIEGKWSASVKHSTSFKDTCLFPVGIENGVIPGSQLKVKEGDAIGSAVRLNGDGQWCRTSENLLIDLGRIMTITGMAFQGKSMVVRKVFMFYGIFSPTTTELREAESSSIRYYSLPNSDNTLRHWLAEKDYFTARYVQFNFEKAGQVCFKVELYGCAETCSSLLTIPSQQIHCVQGDQPFTRFDFKVLVTVTGLMSRNHDPQITGFKIRHKRLISGNFAFLENGKVFNTSIHNQASLIFWFTRQYSSILIDVVPVVGSGCLNVSFLGCPTGCATKLGIESGDPLVTLKASSSYGHSGFAEASDSKLNYVSNSWLRRNTDESPWIQACFDSLKTIRAIAIQGQGFWNWGRVLKYTILYGYEKSSVDQLINYSINGKKTVFRGPPNRYSTKVNDFPIAITAACIRLIPTQWHPNGCAVRWEFLGCHHSGSPNILPIQPINMKKSDTSSSLKCQVISQPVFTSSWKLNGTVERYHSSVVTGSSNDVNGSYVSTLTIHQNITEFIADIDVPCVVNVDKMATCNISYSCSASYKAGAETTQKSYVMFSGLNAVVNQPEILITSTTNTTVTYAVKALNKDNTKDFPTVSISVKINGTMKNTHRSPLLRSYTESGLKPYTSYRMTLTAHNRLNISSNPVLKDFRTDDGVSDPPELQLKKSAATSLVFSWKIPNNPNGVISKYKIKCCRKNCKETVVEDDIDPNSKNATVDGLASLTFYYCQIQAFTGSGIIEGKWSASVKHSTSFKDTCMLPVGIENGVIPDSQLQVKLGPVIGSAVRLNSDGQWCRTSQNLLIDLGRIMTITGMAFQGKSMVFRKVYIYYGVSSPTTAALKEAVLKEAESPNKRNYLLPNSDNTLRHWLAEKDYFTARYVQFNFEQSGQVCLKVELYGCAETCSSILSIPSQQIHCVQGDQPFTRFDFKVLVTVTGLMSRNHNPQVTGFKIRHKKSISGNFAFLENGKVFNSNIHNQASLIFWFTRQYSSIIIDVVPVGHSGCLNVAFFGCPAGCATKLGIESGDSSVTLKASSSYLKDYAVASDSKLNYVSNSWLRHDNDSNPWLQACFEDLKYITAIAIQGQGFNNWGRVLKYTILYGYKKNNDDRLIDYSINGKKIVFTGPPNRYSTKVNDFPIAITAACVRLIPTQWHPNGCAVRWEFLGCHHSGSPKILPIQPINMKKSDTLSSLKCQVISQPVFTPSWKLNGTLSVERYHSSVVTGSSNDVNGSYVSTLTIHQNITEFIADSDVSCVVNADKMATCNISYSFSASYKAGFEMTQKTYVMFSGLNAAVNNPDILIISITNTTVTYNVTAANKDNTKDFPTVSISVTINGNTHISPLLPSYTESGLKPYISYRMILIAHNRLNVSSNKVMKDFRTDEGVPSVSRNVSVSAESKDEILMKWKHPDPPNGLIDKYEFQFKEDRSVMRNSSFIDSRNDLNEMSVSISHLKNYQDYDLRVRAFTKQGELVGPWSEWISVRTLEGEPSAPRSLTGQVKSSTVASLSWKVPSEVNGIIKYYSVRVNGTKSYFGDFSHIQVNSTNQTLIDYNNLFPGTNYSVFVNATTGGGTGVQSNVFTITTDYDEPYEPHSTLTCVLFKHDVIVFEKVPQYTGPISYYDIGFIKDQSSCESITDVNIMEQINATDINKSFEVKIMKGVEAVKLYKNEIELNLYGNYTFCWRAVINDDKGKLLRGSFAKQSIERSDLAKMNNESVTTTGRTIEIPLSEGPQNTKYYRIIVVEGSDTSSVKDLSILKSYEESKTGEAYVTAEFSAESFQSFNSRFVVGDGEYYSKTSRKRRDAMSDEQDSKFLNKELVNGKTYSILQVAYENEKTHHSTPWLSVVTELKSKPVESKSNIGMIAGIVAAAVVLVVVVALAVILFRRHSRLKNAAKPKGANEAINSVTSLLEIGQVNAGSDNDEKKTESTLNGAPPSNMVIDKSHLPIKVADFPRRWAYLKKDSFHEASEEYLALNSGQQFSWDDAIKPDSKPKNRYANIVAYDHSRVRLSTDGGQLDYVNASHIHGYSKRNKFIASQGPNMASISDFWRMVWEQEVGVIIMLTNLVERSKKKCEQYWPSSGTESYGDFEVTLSSVDNYSNFLIRTLTLKKVGSERITQVQQYHYVAWPDHGVPDFPLDIIKLRHRMRKTFPVEQTEAPMLVHCSAGVGRTGTFICLDEMLHMSQKVNKVDIFNFVNFMRSRRIHMVQTEEQYRFIYQALYETFICGITELNASDVRRELQKLMRPNQEGTNKNGFQLQFERLNIVASAENPMISTSDAALMAHNKKKNRYSRILPRGESRVFLTPSAEGDDDDYINAVYVNGYKKSDAFIATQHPLACTTSDFWSMIYQQNIGTIVMLNTIYEEEEAYPTVWGNLNESIDYGQLLVTLLSESTRSVIAEREFEITHTKNGNSIRCKLFQHQKWPNNDIPDNPRDVVDLLTLIEKQQHNHGDGPMAVVCSDGAARSGTFIALSIIMEQLKLEQVVDVFQTVREIRSVRPEFVGNDKQFKFCYDVVQAYIDSFSTYSNYGE